MDTITTLSFPACRTKGKIGINEAAIYNSTAKGRPRLLLQRVRQQEAEGGVRQDAEGKLRQEWMRRRLAQPREEEMFNSKLDSI